jgi:soluble lytic murein transglycosylase-like protein
MSHGNFFSWDGRHRPNWSLFLGSNVILFLVAFMLVDMRMGDASVGAVDPKPAEPVTVPAAKAPDVIAAGKAAVVRTYGIRQFPTDFRESIRPWQTYIRKYSLEFDVDPDLVAAILYVESGGDPKSVSPRGAMGLMQIAPVTASNLGIIDVFDPEQNIRAGTRYISSLIQTYHDELAVLQVYNAGASVRDLNHIPAETTRFVQRVQLLKGYLKNM